MAPASPVRVRVTLLRTSAYILHPGRSVQRYLLFPDNTVYQLLDLVDIASWGDVYLYRQVDRASQTLQPVTQNLGDTVGEILRKQPLFGAVLRPVAPVAAKARLRDALKGRGVAAVTV